MEDRLERATLRFRSMLDSAEQAAQWAAQDRTGVVQPSSLMVVAVKAMNRAGGFLEALSILAPELGLELIEEFETFAARVEGLNQATRAAKGAAGGRDDRRAADRRLRHDRRRRWLTVAVEQRTIPDRRAQWDRRSGKIRELADRRWRSLQR